MLQHTMNTDSSEEGAKSGLSFNLIRLRLQWLAYLADVLNEFVEALCFCGCQVALNICKVNICK